MRRSHPKLNSSQDIHSLLARSEKIKTKRRILPVTCNISSRRTDTASRIGDMQSAQGACVSLPPSSIPCPVRSPTLSLSWTNNADAETNAKPVDFTEAVEEPLQLFVSWKSDKQVQKSNTQNMSCELSFNPRSSPRKNTGPTMPTSTLSHPANSSTRGTPRTAGGRGSVKPLRVQHRGDAPVPAAATATGGTGGARPRGKSTTSTVPSIDVTPSTSLASTIGPLDLKTLRPKSPRKVETSPRVDVDNRRVGGSFAYSPRSRTEVSKEMDHKTIRLPLVCLSSDSSRLNYTVMREVDVDDMASLVENCTLEQQVQFTQTYGQMFYTRPHVNFLGNDPALGPVVISIMKEDCGAVEASSVSVSNLRFSRAPVPNDVRAMQAAINQSAAKDGEKDTPRTAQSKIARLLGDSAEKEESVQGSSSKVARMLGESAEKAAQEQHEAGQSSGAGVSMGKVSRMLGIRESRLGTDRKVRVGSDGAPDSGATADTNVSGVGGVGGNDSRDVTPWDDCDGDDDEVDAKYVVSDERKYISIIRTKQGEHKPLVSAANVRVRTTGGPSAHPRHRSLLKALKKEVHPHLSQTSLRPSNSPKLTEALVRLESSMILNGYKFGVLYIKPHQMNLHHRTPAGGGMSLAEMRDPALCSCVGSEASGSGDDPSFSNFDDMWLSNQHAHTSQEYKEFLALLGDEIALDGWDRFRGGLDVKGGSTGERSVYTACWEQEVMFHVSTLLPYDTVQTQQISRKRHIGNDIVVLVFCDAPADGNEDDNFAIDPTIISSEFIHVYLIVRPHGPDHYRLSVCARADVPGFGPPLPLGGLVAKSMFRKFILAKAINAERASYQAAAFAHKIIRTRNQLLANIVKDYYHHDKTTRSGGGDGTSVDAMKRFLPNLPTDVVTDSASAAKSQANRLINKIKR